jgi:hypothetical protein
VRVDWEEGWKETLLGEIGIGFVAGLEVERREQLVLVGSKMEAKIVVMNFAGDKVRTIERQWFSMAFIRGCLITTTYKKIHI